MVGRTGDSYALTAEQIQSFHKNGYATLPGFLTEEEVMELEQVFDLFVEGKIDVPGKDFCDMSQPFGIPFEKWQLVNAMLPREYYPDWKGNIFEQLCDKAAKQLFPNINMTLDYDQLLMKRPQQKEAVFAWHQDLAYWPQDTPDNYTVTFSLAINTANQENGCLRVIPGSHKEESLRIHRPLSGSRDEGHALTVDLLDSDEQVYLPVNRGDVTIHEERIVHGSPGNVSKVPRKTYVIAFRSVATVEHERSIGFTHSHNTEQNWDTFISQTALNKST